MAEQTALRVLLIPDHRGNEAVFAQTYRLGSGDNHVVEHDHAQRMQRAKGVEITVNFITQYITAAVGIIQAALTMAAIPVGTAIGAAEIIGLIGAILTYIMVWVNAMLGMITSMVEMENAAHQAVPGGQWPKAVV